MKKLFIRQSLFAVPLVVLFLTFLNPQSGRADCPDDWWCEVDPPNPEVNNNPFEPWEWSPGFSLVLCLNQDGCNLSSTLPAPNVTIKSSNGCTTMTDVTLEGPAICAASNDGVVDLNSVAACSVFVKIPDASCDLDSKKLATYSKFQFAKQPPETVFDPASKITIAGGTSGWPSFSFSIGTELCNSFNGCVAKFFPETGEGFRHLGAGQVLKGDQKNNYISLRGCKGETSASITCEEQGNILTGGGEASVAVKCPQPNFAGNREVISPNSGNNGVDLFGNSLCPLNGIVQSSVEINGVPASSCQPQAGNRIRCFFNEGAVYAASGCTSGNTVKLIATGDIVVPQGTGTVTVPFFTDPGDTVTCG